MKQNHLLKIGFVIFLKGAPFSDFVDYRLLNYMPSGTQICILLFWFFFFSIRFQSLQAVSCLQTQKNIFASKYLKALEESSKHYFTLLFKIKCLFVNFKLGKISQSQLCAGNNPGIIFKKHFLLNIDVHNIKHLSRFINISVQGGPYLLARYKQSNS